MAKPPAAPETAPDALVWARPVPAAVGTIHREYGQLADGPMQIPASALKGSATFKACPAPKPQNDTDKEKA